MEPNGSGHPAGEGTTRRRFLELATLTSALAAAASYAQEVFTFPKLSTVRGALGTLQPNVVDVVVIGSGFGGTLSALTLARHFKNLSAGGSPKGRVVVLERGQWWTTPYDTIQDATVRAYDLLKEKQQPVQRWVSADNFRGLFDLLTRCVRTPKNPGGLLEITQFKAPAGKPQPRLSAITSSGVGGGSLVYQNVTIEPPAAVLSQLPIKWEATDDKWTATEWLNLARKAISWSVLAAWDNDPVPAKTINNGLSRIVARSFGMDPSFKTGTTKYDSAAALKSRVWMNRPRLFHRAAEELAQAGGYAGLDWGAVELSINDYGAPAFFSTDPKDPKFDPNRPSNVCERQGRCMIGCLPGARHTLNKQLVRALWKAPDGSPAQINDKAVHLEVQARTEVLYIEPVAPAEGRGKYRVVYRRDGKIDSIEADRVIVASGTLGSTALLLRSKLSPVEGGYGTLPKLSPVLGTRFTNNGDFLAFLEDVKEPVNLFRGPNATSFIHVWPDNPTAFHTLEDAGIPNVFSSLFSRGSGPGTGSAFIRRVAKDGLSPAVVASAVGGAILRDLKNAIDRLLHPAQVDDTTFGAEGLAAQKVLGLAGIGRDAANGMLTLTKDGQLRLHRADGKAYADDSSIAAIQNTIKDLAGTSTLKAKPFTPYSDPKDPMALGTLHPLGGCPIGGNVAEGVANDVGQVYNYDQLYIADGSLFGQSLGVNPSLTISALTLRIAKDIVNRIDPNTLRPTAIS
jgi:cholesterol oxidase